MVGNPRKMRNGPAVPYSLSDAREWAVGSEPDDEIEVEVEPDDIDVEAVTDVLEPASSLVDAPGLGLDLPEADTLDQRRDVPFDEEEGAG
jgi:hypothetical protein